MWKYVEVRCRDFPLWFFGANQKSDEHMSKQSLWHFSDLSLPLFVSVCGLHLAPQKKQQLHKRRKSMVWRWMLDNCHAAVGEHLLCVENERSHTTLNFQESFHKAWGDMTSQNMSKHIVFV